MQTFKCPKFQDQKRQYLRPLPQFRDNAALGKICRLPQKIRGPETPIGSADANSSGCESADRAAAQPQPWLVSPLFDALFVCGIAPWLFGFAMLVSNPALITGDAGNQDFTSVFLIIAALIIGESHQFTSILKYVFDPVARMKGNRFDHLPILLISATFGFILILIAILILFGSGSLIGSFIGSIFGPPIMTLFAFSKFFQFIFPVVLMQHVCAQAKGVGLVYCGKSGFKLNDSEKIHLSACTWFLSIVGAFTIAAPFGITQEHLDGDLGSFRSIAMICALLEIGYFSLCLFNRGRKTDEWLPKGSFLLWGNLLLFVFLPFSWMSFIWIFVPVFYHATQHWTIAWLSHKQSSHDNDMVLPPRQLFLSFLRLLIPVQAVSLTILFFPMIMTSLNLGGVLNGFFGTGILSVEWSMLVFYLHYLSDRIVWRPK